MRRILSVALVVMLSVAAVFAWSANLWVGGNNEYMDANHMGLNAFGDMNAGYTEATYIQVALNGFTGRGSCWRGEGMDQYGWCTDSAHMSLDGYYSAAGHEMNVVPYGWYFATSRVYINNTFMATRQAASYFQEPPNCDNPTTQFDYSHCPGSPIIIATGPARSYRLTSAAAGVLFDLDNDGVPERRAWTVAGDDVAFLALDRNGNGTIDSGFELFGDHTAPQAGNGFQALRYVGGLNNDAALDAADPLFAKLLLWTDSNHNGISEPDELTPAADVLESIGLGYAACHRKDGHGNEYRYEGWARRSEVGRSGRVPPSANAFKSQRAREFSIYDAWLAAQ